MSTEVAKQEDGKKVSPKEALRQALTQMRDQFEYALPKHIPSDRFIRTVMTAVQNTPDLLAADRNSLYSSCMKAAQDGLIPDGNEAALVLYKEKGRPVVRYLPMYQGILKKVRNTKELASISAHVVYENDAFEFILGDEERIVHKPAPVGQDRGKPIGAYAIGRLKDGSIQREFMSLEDLKAIENVSKASYEGRPWQAWWDQMAKKTVLRRLCKLLPQSSDLARVFAHDNENYDLSKTIEGSASPVLGEDYQLTSSGEARLDDFAGETAQAEAPALEDENQDAPPAITTTPHALPVPKTKGNPDWNAWGQSMIDALSKAGDEIAAKGWVSENARALQQAHDEAPDVYELVMKASMDRESELREEAA